MRTLREAFLPFKNTAHFTIATFTLAQQTTLITRVAESLVNARSQAAVIAGVTVLP